MVVTITGKNWSLAKQELDKLTSEFVKKNDKLALEKIDGENADFNDILTAAEGVSLLSAEKMVIVRDLSKNPDASKNIEQIIKSIPKSTDVIFVEPQIDRRSSFYKSLKKLTDLREFPEFDEQELISWLKGYTEEYGGNISTENARYLVSRAGVNQSKLASEIIKLTTHNKNITKTSIDELVTEVPQSTVFNLIDAAFAKNFKKAIRLYDDQRAQNQDPIAIVSMIIWQVNILAIVHSAEDRTPAMIAKEAGINPFVVRKSKSIANQLSRKQIIGMMDELLELEHNLKTKKVNEDDQIKQFLINLSQL